LNAKNRVIHNSNHASYWRYFAGWLAVLWVGLNVVRAEEYPQTTPDGFAVPQPGRKFVFPRDYGSHPEFAIEWWYITGHLFATNQTSPGAQPARFGFQATFFRRSTLSPDATNGPGSAAFGNDQIYLAHMTLVDIGSGIFRHEERLNRGGWDAASSTNTLDVRNGNWSLRLSPDATNEFDLQCTVGADVANVLQFIPKKPLVVFGTNGISRKAADFKASSHYLTFPRLAARGVVTIEETNFPVQGEAWMDHEFSSSQVGEGQVGWDWLSLQLNDGRELMAYRMRRTDGTTDPFSTVAWVDTAATVRHVGPAQFQWTVLEHWRSPHTGANYPSLVRLSAVNPQTGKTEAFTIEPLVADQELTGKLGGVAYWEGACRVLDDQKKEIGRAYMELTGYGESLNGKF
jgi:predicted secreted hydrolase